MSAGRKPEYDGGTMLTPFVLDVVEWLDECFDKMDSGRESEIISDPFYTPRTGALTEERVDKVIAALDEEFAKEIDDYPSYHERRSGANAKPEFSRMGSTARRAMAEGLTRIIEEHEDYNKQVTLGHQPSSGPAYSGGGWDQSC